MVLRLALFPLCLLAAACSTSAPAAEDPPPAMPEAEAEVERFGLTADQYAYVEAESAPGGRMDFSRELAADQLYVVDDVAYNRRDMGLLLWGGAVKKLGVTTADDAVALYRVIGPEELGEPQERALRAGFAKDFGD